MKRSFFTALFAAITILVYASVALADHIKFKAEPVTEDEKAVARLLDSVRTLKADAYTEDAVIEYLYGQYNEPHAARGRQEINALFSSGQTQKVFYRDIVIKVEGENAVVTGETVLCLIFRATIKLTKFNENVWKLKKDKDVWLINRQKALKAFIDNGWRGPCDSSTAALR